MQSSNAAKTYRHYSSVLRKGGRIALPSELSEFRVGQHV